MGEASVEARKVEASFEWVDAVASEWWRVDAGPGLRAPIGRMGARGVQHLDLGWGTAQHALTVGRNGSGKSNLMHVIITGLAVTYSPDEVGFYLVDLKKGVDFKDYA